jgi:allantoate deiminase
VRASSCDRLHDAAQEIASGRGLTLEWEPRLEHAAVKMSARLMAALTRAVEHSGVRPTVISSGAGHDAMILAERMPAAMLMIRSPGGISHHPDESVSDDDVAAALAAGSAFLEQMEKTACD